MLKTYYRKVNENLSQLDKYVKTNQLIYDRFFRRIDDNMVDLKEKFENLF